MGTMMTILTDAFCILLFSLSHWSFTIDIHIFSVKIAIIAFTLGCIDKKKITGGGGNRPQAPAGGGRGGARRGGRGGAGRGGRRPVPTVEQLDAELDAYVKEIK